MKKLLIIILAAALGLTGCGSAANDASQSASSTEEITTQAPTFAPVTVTTEATEATTVDLADLPADPPYDYDIDTMLPKDFGELFTSDYEGGSTTSYKLLDGTSLENEVTVIKGAQDGPTVYVIAGIHGNEEAAWRSGELLERITIKAGTLYILAPANRWGAYSEPQSRYISGKDPNRAFPGDPDGTDAQKYAYAVYNDVKKKNPDFVFDLHEAIVIEEGRDYLGSSLIYTDMSLFGDLLIDMVLLTQDGDLCNHAMNYYSPGPDGSINKTITEGLGIATLTVETFRGYQMEDRIFDQLSIVQYVLRDYGMVD